MSGKRPKLTAPLHQLLGSISGLYQDVLEEVLALEDLPSDQYRLLVLAWNAPKIPFRKALSASGGPAYQLTRNVQWLEKRDLAFAERSETDKRKSRILLTDQGEKTLRRVEQAVALKLRQRMPGGARSKARREEEAILLAGRLLDELRQPTLVDED
jgi:DNA-binding MarR family transcriptional regulator